MPQILAIESSTPRASLALLRDSDVIFEASYESDRKHNSMLFEPLSEALEMLGGRGLDAVVVGTGPGSYSGTRVGIAAGQGVAMVHDCPAVGLSSLMAVGIEEGTAVGDARRGSAWLADLRSDALPEPRMLPVDELAGRIAGAPDPFSIEDVSKLGLPSGAGVRLLHPTAVGLAHAWLRLSEELRRSLTETAPQPAYLRPPHVTEAKRGHPLLRSDRGA